MQNYALMFHRVIYRELVAEGARNKKRQERQVLLLSIDTLLQTYGIDTLLHTSSTAWVTLLLYKRVTLQMALVKWYKSDEKSRNCTLQIVIAKPLSHSIRNKNYHNANLPNQQCLAGSARQRS